MKSIVKRCLLVVAVIIVVLVCIAFWNSRQRVTLINPSANVRQAGNRSATSAPISSDKIVLLDVRDFGYSAYVRGVADECAYDNFYVEKGVMVRGEDPASKPMVIRAHTRAAVNLQQDTSAINGAQHPSLIDSLPWTYVTCGIPAWMRHPFTITSIANDGTVTITNGNKGVLLKPGGEVKIERSMGVWRSTVTITHRGLFEKNNISQSKWLSVVTY